MHIYTAKYKYACALCKVYVLLHSVYTAYTLCEVNIHSIIYAWSCLYVASQ
jgi:hypothetical protein